MQDTQYKKGLVIVHTGNGKGKTTAALGLAIRAWGEGLKVLILQWQLEIWRIKSLSQICSRYHSETMR
jgi:cob(I)alamin adenosyltransferase